MSELTDTRAADGTHTTNGTPHGFSSITPFIVVADPASAARFYHVVLSAELLAVSEADGEVIHVELALPNGHLQLGSAGPSFHLVPAPVGDDVCYSFGFYCPDVDTVLAVALENGATLREPLTTFVSGDRYANIRDPFGVRWSLMTRVEDLSSAESAGRVKAWVTANS